MIEIYQGGNSPIILQFDANFEATKLEASLHHPAIAEIQHWSIDDVTISGSTVTLPINEAQSVNYPSGKCLLSVKVLDSDNNIIFYGEEEVKIVYQFDKTRFLGLE